MGDMQPAAGSLLIASATLVDPNFARCVLLILESNDDGSLGVILNQPSETPVDEVLDQWRDVVNPPGVFFRGGPVELNAALAIGTRSSPLDDPPLGWRQVVRVARDGGPRRLARRPPRPARRAAHLRGVRRLGRPASSTPRSRRAAGTSYPPSAGDLFSDRPDRLWRDILRRQPPPLSMLATLPEDASLN